MATLFALGVMSLTWMALIAALFTIERLAPRLLASCSIAILLVVLGIAVALGALAGA